VVAYCGAFGGSIPMSFILGFYLGIIIKRWWDQILYMSWPDNVAILVSTIIVGQVEIARIMRRTIMRYVNLTITLAWRYISPPVKKRFSTYEKLIDYGLLMKSESDILKKWDQKFPKLLIYWMPIVWACSVCIRGRKEGMVRDDFTLTSLLVALDEIRQCCHKLMHYTMIPIPLVYTQVVTLVCYTYFLGGLITHQLVPYHFPIILLLEFVLYMGLLKVAETTIGPFGTDDEDLEVSSTNMIASHMSLCIIIFR